MDKDRYLKRSKLCRINCNPVTVICGMIITVLVLIDDGDDGDDDGCDGDNDHELL